MPQYPSDRGQKLLNLCQIGKVLSQAATISVSCGCGSGLLAGSSGEPSHVECRDLIRGLLQLHPCARLGLQQVAAHCWMLPAEHILSSTLGATPGGAWLTVIVELQGVPLTLYMTLCFGLLQNRSIPSRQ